MGDPPMPVLSSLRSAQSFAEWITDRQRSQPASKGHRPDETASDFRFN